MALAVALAVAFDHSAFKKVCHRRVKQNHPTSWEQCTALAFALTLAVVFDHSAFKKACHRVFNCPHLNKVAVYDRVPERRVVHADLGLARREMRLKVDADPPKAAKVVEKGTRLKLAKQALEARLKK
jgi:hypothetical protein